MNRLHAALVVVLVVILVSPAPAQQPTIADLEDAIAQAIAEAPASEAREVNLPLARLKLKKATLLAAGRGGMFAIGNPQTEIDAGLALIEQLNRGEVYQPPRCTMTELAYVTENDRTVQPFYVYLPASYDPARAWPLIVFLHGYVPSISVVDPWLLSDEVGAIAERNGAILVLPYGRRNTDFQGVGEVDVLAVIEQMRQRFSIDAARIHLSGVSMGGMGTWTIGLRNPGMFASLTPISGQTDMFRWWRWDRERMTPFKRFLVEWDNAEEMAPNARGQSIFLQHGEMDHLIPVIESRSMVSRVQALDIPIGYHEFPGESHYIYWDTPCYENAWGFAREQVLNPAPAHVSFRCYSLAYNRAFWLTIDRLKRWGTPGEVDARISDDGTRLDLTCENVAALTIDLRVCPVVAAPGAYQVTVNGATRLVTPDDQHRLPIEIEPPPGDGTAKRRGLCGPAEDVFNTRFIVVQGTAGSAEENTILAQQVGLWAEEWDAFADGQPTVRTDTELTEDEARGANLVLFGTPQTNSVLARIADRLPVEIGDHRYTVLGRTFQGPNLGLVLCYPNPEQPDRYVLIYAGELYGRRLSANHKHDMLPDFLIFDATRFTTGDTEANVFGGWFDVDWLPKPDLAWEGDEDAAARLPEG